MENRYSTIIRYSIEDDGFVAICPELQGVSAFGETPEEALVELQIARTLVIESLIANGSRLPEPALLHVSDAVQRQRERRMRYAEAQLRQRASERGLNWDVLDDDAREAFIDDLLHD